MITSNMGKSNPRKIPV